MREPFWDLCRNARSIGLLGPFFDRADEKVGFAVRAIDLKPAASRVWSSKLRPTSNSIADRFVEF
jgi:hypothetical protein